MKRCLLTISFCFFFCVSFAQDTNENTYINQQYEFLKEQQNEVKKEYEAITEELKEERQNHQNFVKWVYTVTASLFTGLGIAVLVIVFRYQTNSRKDAETRIDEIQQSAESTVNNKTEEIKNDAIIKIANAAQENPEIIREIVDDRMRDLALKKDVKIGLIYHNDDEEDKNNLITQLHDYNVNVTKKNIQEYPVNPEYTPLPEDFFDKKEEHVFFILDLTENKITKYLNQKLKDESIQNKGFFYMGKSKFEPENAHLIVNFSNSPSTLYQNFMDLLRYLHFRNIL